MVGSNQGIQQSAAWECFGELRNLVGLHAGLQEAEWQHRLSQLSGIDTFAAFDDTQTRCQVFDNWLERGLVQRRYAAELDTMQKTNQGLRAVISDKIFACSAFPLCSSPLCFCGCTFRNGHERSIRDKTIEIPGCEVRAYFRHRNTITEAISQIHESQRSQAAHDDAVNSLLNDLLFHRKRGCIIEGTCPDCRQTFQPLEIESISEFVPEYQYRGIGDVHFVFDIAGLVGGEEDKSLSVVFELLNTHTMDNEKREYLNSIDIPWIESANERRRTDHSKCTKTGVISTFEPVYTTETVPVLKDIEIISKRCEDMLQDIAGKKGMLDDVLSFTRDIDEDC